VGLPFPLGRAGQDRADVLALQIREVMKDLVFAHPAGEILEDIADGDPQAADARSSAALPRLDRDP
jgi:hypothetical protein